MMFCLISCHKFLRILYITWIFNIIGVFGTVIQWRPYQERILREFLQHEVIIPRLTHGHRHITTTKTQTGHLGAITLTLETSNVTLVIDFHLNRNLFTSSYIEKYFAEDGSEILRNLSDHHHSHCYYHGRLRNDPRSTAAISTCHGIRGSLHSSLGDYHIEPTVSLINAHHFIFNDVHQRPSNLTCGHTQMVFTGFYNKRKPSRLKREAVKEWPYDSNDHTRVVEMYIVNDKTEYDAYDKDLTQVLARTKDIINIVSSLYRPINVYIALVGIEVWTDADKIDVVENPDNTMNNFLTYRRSSIKQPNDNAQLITGKQLGSGVVGKAPIMTICSWQYSGGVNNDHNLVVGPVATTVAHELGHNFGLSHDSDKCGCPDDRCIMAASSGGINNPTKWSKCSQRQFTDAFAQGMDYCLLNLPQAIYGPSTCGNGFMEEGEQCDCGLSQDCNTACCDPFTCKLTENATCATGACCDLDTCKPMKAATVCRDAVGSCDLPETCNGRDESCPPDYHLVDGKPCTTQFGSTFCYHGLCRTHESQCQLLWGRTGHKSHDACYQHFNKMGERSGHCGFKWIGSEFTPCNSQDVLCGMLHCSHRNEKLMFWKEALSQAMPEGQVTLHENNHYVRKECKGAILDVGLDMPDPGMVPDGATCGVDKICVSQHCKPLADLDVVSCPDCHGHGVCNNVGECHCDRGHGSPFCDVPGNGGSLSGGPMEINNDNVSLIVGLCIFFLIILPLLCVAGYYGYKNRKTLKKMLLHGPAEGYRMPQINSSIYRAKPRNDAVTNKNKPVYPVSCNPSTVSNHIVNSTTPGAPPTHSYIVNGPRSKISRSISFRTEDISKPKLDSSTKRLADIPTLRHSVCGPIIPTRPAPERPALPRDWNATNVSTRPPSRPPLPRGGYRGVNRRAGSPRAHLPMPSEPTDPPNYNDVGTYPTAPDRTNEIPMGLMGGDPKYGNDDRSPEFSDIILESPEEDGMLPSGDITCNDMNGAYVASTNPIMDHNTETNGSVVNNARKPDQNVNRSASERNRNTKTSNIGDQHATRTNKSESWQKPLALNRSTSDCKPTIANKPRIASKPRPPPLPEKSTRGVRSVPGGGSGDSQC